MTTAVRDRSVKLARAGEVAFGRDMVTQRPVSRALPRSSGADPDMRTCTVCGEHVPFRIDPLGSWAECTACGRLN